jgi:hypothetical protein
LEDHDSAVTLLQELEKERGTVFTEKEYHEIRESVLEELTRGPKARLSLLVTFGVIGLLLLILTVVGFYIVHREMVHDYTLALAGLCALGVWGFLLRGYLRSVDKHNLRSLPERLGELEELRARQLLTQEEFDRISAAIHISRGVPRQRRA